MKGRIHLKLKRFFNLQSFIIIFCAYNLLFFPSFAEAGNERTVALVMKALSNPFFFKMEEGARNYAGEENITLEVFGVERETDVERQIGIVYSAQIN